MAAHLGPKISKSNLVLHLDPGSSESYPGTGTTFFDLSGNNNNATLINTPTFSNGVIDFNGTDEYMQITNSSSLNFQSEQTVIMFLYHTFTSGRRNPWDQAYGGYGTWTHEQGNNINYYFGDAGSNTTPYTALNSGTTNRSEWNCLVVTRDISFVRWYRNGSQVSITTNPYADQPITSANIRIGFGYAGYWQGQMGPVLAFNRALSASEVLEIFNAFRGRFGI